MGFVKIACAVFNRYFIDVPVEKPEHQVIASCMLSRVETKNVLFKKIIDKNLEKLLVASQLAECYTQR